MMKMNLFRFLVVLFFLGIVSSNSEAQIVQRGPYLQLATHNSIIIRWRTNTPTDSRVRYGTTAGNLSMTATDATSTTEHSIEITGLSPYTKYYYAIGTTSGDLAGNDTTHFFRTNPVPGTVQPIRVWVLGDFGKANSVQIQARNDYQNYAATHGQADLWLWLGDNAYQNGTDTEFQQKVFDSTYGYPEIFRNHVFWPTPGNHDYNSVNRLDPPPSHTGPYYDIVDVPTQAEAGGVASTYELYYSFDYGNIHFISLNSELQAWTSSSTSEMATWLQNDLASNTQPWTVAYFHQPPHTKGSHDSDAIWEVLMSFMRTNYMPILENYGVDLVLCGHSHVYERSKLMRGFYGFSWQYSAAQHAIDDGSGNFAQGEPYVKYTQGPTANHGTVYVVSGNGGSNTASASLNHPIMHYSHGCDTCAGSFLIEVNGDRLDGKYLAVNGAILDEFTILKSNAVSVEEPDFPLLQNVLIHPNPFDETLAIDFTLMERSRMSIELYSLDGKRVFADKIGRRDAGEHRVTISSSDTGLTDGTYLVRVVVGKEAHVQRVVRMK